MHNSPFIHLHVHTEYSLLDGAIPVSALVDRCVQNQIPAATITDNGVMYGVVDFYLECKAKKIKPIIGCELYLCADMSVKNREMTRLILLCQNYAGYRLLSQIVSSAHLDGFYYKPRVDLNLLRSMSDNLIAIAPGYRGPIASEIRANNNDNARKVARELKEIYGDRFYLGIQVLGTSLEDVVTEELAAIGKELDIPLVATNDVYYMAENDALLRDILNAIQMGKILDEDSRRGLETNQQYFKDIDEMAEKFSAYPNALENTWKIAERCDLKFETDQELPRFECPDGKAPEVYLEELVWAGISKKYPELSDAIRQRVNFELDIIKRMKYPVYFLVIHDFLKFCDDVAIPVGPGRGSAAGSIVAYALNITRIDPLRYNLLFERFLNPERVSMPDIDLDFCIKRRGEVIDYIVRKYGVEHVAQIITFGTMAARAVVRDVGRVLGVPLSDVDKVAKLIPSSPGQYTSIPQALEIVPDLKKLYDGDSTLRKLLDYGMRLEGFSRHSSTHAAGIVISREPLSTVVPLTKNEGQVATQFSMTNLEKIGLLKMDILGLRNLTVIEEARRLIKVHRGIELNIETIALDDAKTYALLASGETAGVFQLEGTGMRQLIRDLKPETFEDIIALLALYRPGPLGSGMVSEFISNKSGKTQVRYELPPLEPILKDTYGMIVYQEQVMQIASSIGGFSLAEADMLRRAMGKKKKEEMDKLKGQFIQGAVSRGFPEDKATKIFDLCYKFAEYGFNKSHSAAYALISYQTAYLKANFGLEYMTALLSSVLGSTDKMALYIDDCRKLGLQVLPPDVNESEFDFSISNGAVRYGLGAVKNVGQAAIENLVAARQTAPFQSLADLASRVDLRQLNKRVFESLIKCGAFDSLEKDRGFLLATYEKALEQSQVAAKERSSGQTGLFGDFGTVASLRPEDVDYLPATPAEKLKMEKEMLGLYLSGHPLDQIRDKLGKFAHHSGNIGKDDDGKVVTVAGLLTDCRRVLTKTKKEMLLGTLDDLSGSLSLVIFQGENFDTFKQAFVDDNIVAVKGRIRVSQDEISLSCMSVEVIADLQPTSQIHVDLTDTASLAMIEDIRKICMKNRGAAALYLHLENQVILAHRKYWVSPEVVEKLSVCAGQTRVWEA